MNGTSMDSARTPYAWMNRQWESGQISKKPFVEGAAAFNAVVAYHPLRTMGIQLTRGEKINLSPSILYRGFTPGLLAAHQLFLMGAFEASLKERYTEGESELMIDERIAIGAVAGVLTVPTVVPLELLTLLKQAKQALPNKKISTLYRGFSPMVMRQMGLGAGIFTLPEYFFKKIQAKHPEFSAENETVVKVSSSIAGGAVTATATQCFEVSRQLMQNDICREKYPTTKSAFTEAFKKMKTVEGAKLAGLRFGVLALTAVVINATKEQCKNWQQQEGQQ